MGASFLKKPWLLPPQLAAWQRPLVRRLRGCVPQDKNVFWIFSSGTQSVNQVKCLAVTKDALFESAQAVNNFLLVTKRDRWSIEIPTYHIGGFAILARAYLSGSSVYKSSSWNAKRFTKRVMDKKITLTSLVPTQVFDLVEQKLRAPKCLRAAVIGGGALDQNLYRLGRELGWPLLPSYGLTECASQVATASLSTLESTSYPGLTVLPHAQVRLDDQKISLQCKSLCQWIATVNQAEVFTLEEPLRRGWYATEDLGEWVGPQIAGRPQSLKILGRRDDVVKIYGVLVSVPQVESDFKLAAVRAGEKAGSSIAVVARQEGREGARLYAVVDQKKSLDSLRTVLKTYNASVNGPYRVHDVLYVAKIPRTSLGKIKRAELLALDLFKG